MSENNERVMLDEQFEDLPKELFERAYEEDKNLHDMNIEGKALGFFADAVYRFRRNKASLTAFWIICVIIFMAIVGPNMNHYTYREQNSARLNMPPRVQGLEKIGILDGHSVLTNRRKDGLSDTTKYPEGCVVRVFNERVYHGVEMVDVEVDAYKMANAEDEYYWIGSDYLGRDLWTRLWRGCRVSLVIAVVAVLTNITIGIIYGAIAGYYGGAIDMVMMRFCEVIHALPQVVVVTMFILLFGSGIKSLILALVVRGWVATARMIRAQFLRFRGREYVMAARTLGVPDRALIFRHILPNSIGPIITRAMMAIPSGIFTESFLAYIGLGLPAPEPSIGVLLSEGQKVLMQYPYQTFFPAAVISILMIGFNLMGNGLRDAFDPTQRGQE